MQTAYQNYKKQEVEGATKGKIVVLLFEGTIKFLRKASKAIDEDNIQEAHNNIVKAVFKKAAAVNKNSLSKG